MVKLVLRGSRSVLWAAVGLFLWANPAFGQTGTLAGVVVDAETGETLIGANVVLDGTTTGSTTNIDGEFEIKGITPGTYVVVFSYIGFNSKTVQGVDISAGETARLEVSLASESIELGDVVVEAEVARNSEAILLRDRQKAAAVSDAISAEAISRSGSGDAAAAMTKVTGASVVGGKYVYIRGLGDRYSNTTLNGSELPSADPDRKAFQLDLFPASLLENIVTLKTFTPDKPGSFSGGLVNVGTKSFPEAFTLQFSFSTTYDSQASLNDDFLTYPNGDVTLSGFSEGVRELPALIRNQDVEWPTAARARDFRLTDAERLAAADSLDRFSRAFNTVMTPTRSVAPVDNSFSGAVGGRTTLFGRLLGYSGSLTYGRNYTYYDDATFGRWNLVGAKVAEAERLLPEVFFSSDPAAARVTGADSLEFGNYANVQGVAEVNWGGTGTLSYRPHPNHEVTSTFLRTQSATAETRYLAGFRDQSRASTFTTRTLGYKERSLTTLQVRGKHFLRPVTADWNVSLGNNTQDEPDLRYFSSNINVLERDGALITRYSLPGGNAPPPERYFRRLEEDNLSANLDLSVPFRTWNGLSSKVKFGGTYSVSDRSFRQRRFIYEQGTAIRYQDFEGDDAAYFETVGLASADEVNGAVFPAFNLWLRENTLMRNDYDADRTVAAGYGMLELPLTRSLRLVGGARLERTDLDLASLDEDLADSVRFGRLDDLDVLPSLNAVYAVGEDMNLRAAFTRTLARPTFRELAPYQSLAFIGGYIFEGNPGLERTLITNYDLRWEWFVRPGELLAVSGFYKQFDQPIERVIKARGEGRFLTVQNVPEGIVYGAEFEARKRLDGFLDAPVLRNLQLGGNFSIVHSEVDIPQEELRIIRAADPGAGSKRPLEGQSPYLLNLDATYQNTASGTVMSLYYNVFGERLVTVTNGAAPDVYEQPRGDLDFTFSQRVLQHFRLKFSAKNILGTDVEQTQEFKGESYTYVGYSRARTFSLGLSYEL